MPTVITIGSTANRPARNVDKIPVFQSHFAAASSGSSFFECVVHSFTFRSRKALLMTETELRLIAAPATMGLSGKPKNG